MIAASRCRLPGVSDMMADGEEILEKRAEPSMIAVDPDESSVSSTLRQVFRLAEVPRSTSHQQQQLARKQSLMERSVEEAQEVRTQHHMLSFRRLVSSRSSRPPPPAKLFRRRSSGQGTWALQLCLCASRVMNTTFTRLH
jgi:hypothetical protein